MKELGSVQRQGQVWHRWPSVLAGALALSLGAAPAFGAPLNTVCPPPPEGVFGLPGAPQFAAPTPDTFGGQLDDPRWNGNYRLDFTDASSSEAAVRMLRDGDALYVSFEARVDPDGAAANVDGIYVGFSQDGTTAVMTNVTMTAGPPLTNSNAISAAKWWKTTNGGATSWHEQSVPQTWATGTNVHAWSGTGTGPGASAWALNAKFSLTDIGAALGGGPLTGPFRMWFEINVHTAAAGPIPYDWPSGSTLGMDTSGAPCTGSTPCAVLPVSTFGTAYPTLTTDSPTGIKIDPMSIGVLPLSSGGVPGTTVHYGAGHAANDFVAVMTDTSGAAIAANTVEGRFRIADWGSVIGVGGDWKDMVTDGSGHPVLGLNANTGSQVVLHCVNPPDTSAPECFQLPAGASTDQCLLVELAQHGGSGATFVSSSARRNMDFVNASTFERSAGISVRGLTPLAGSGGTRDTYIYVRTLNMPAETNGNPPVVVPDPVPPPPAKGRESAAPQVNDGKPPRYRMTTYDRYASVMPTYEVHIYHDTGRTRFEAGAVRKVLEPQAAFGYFVQHTGDLSGWRTALTGEGFVLEELSPSFYRAKIPDHGSVKVHTKIDSCQRVMFGLINHCGTGCGGCQCTMGGTDVTAGVGALSLVAFALACRLRRRRPRA